MNCLHCAAQFGLTAIVAYLVTHPRFAIVSKQEEERMFNTDISLLSCRILTVQTVRGEPLSCWLLIVCTSECLYCPILFTSLTHSLTNTATTLPDCWYHSVLIYEQWTRKEILVCQTYCYNVHTSSSSSSFQLSTVLLSLVTTMQ